MCPFQNSSRIAYNHLQLADWQLARIDETAERDRWITFDKHPNGGVTAKASGPITSPGGPVGAVATVRADTNEDAERLLLAKLKEIGA